MPTTTKTYTYNGSEITNTGVGIKFTDGTISPKNWEQVWSDDYKKSKGLSTEDPIDFNNEKILNELVIRGKAERKVLSKIKSAITN